MATRQTPLQRFIGLIPNDALGSSATQFIPHHTESFQLQRIVRSMHPAPLNLDPVNLPPLWLISFSIRSPGSQRTDYLLRLEWGWVEVFNQKGRGRGQRGGGDQKRTFEQHYLIQGNRSLR